MALALRTVFIAALLSSNIPYSRAAAQSDDVTIRISYVFSINRIRPTPQNGIKTQTNLTLVLSGSSTVTERRDTHSGRSSNQGSFSRGLGEAKGSATQWTVIGANQLRRIVNYPQNQTIIDVRVSGASCQVSVKYVLKPDFKEFMLPRLVTRELAYYDSPRVLSTSCQIK
jgi:hypothetical protein